MPATPVAVIPLKDFAMAKQRLDLPGESRENLAQAVAAHVADACREVGFTVAIVTASAAVAEWAGAIGLETLAETPGAGLDGAAAAGAAAAGGDRPWLVVHGDLPLLAAEDLAAVATALMRGDTVVAPSRDGGTNLLGSQGTFAFGYGPGSFHRHLHAAGGRSVAVIVRAGTAIEIDTLPDLEAAVRLPAGAWLTGFLS